MRSGLGVEDPCRDPGGSTAWSRRRVAWAEQLEELKAAWSDVPQSRTLAVASWWPRLTSMTDEVAALRAQGRWNRGPTDLLTVCRLHRRELAQSAALAWVCDPEARHGLGDRFLRAVLAQTGDAPDVSPSVEVEVEVTRGRSRADVVVSGPFWSIVLEVKVDAGEGDGQCQRLFDDWSEDPDPRFVFLTRTGYHPISAFTVEARQAWRPMRWGHVLKLLREAAALGDLNAPGRPALEEWMRTLGHLYGRGVG